MCSQAEICQGGIATNAENLSNVRQLLTEISPDGPNMQPTPCILKEDK